MPLVYFSNKYWKGPEGRNFIQPKSQGEILMLSRMQAREFGLGLGTLLSEDMRTAINLRREGKSSKAEGDAMLVHNRIEKMKL